jgi:hypothetical protein
MSSSLRASNGIYLLRVPYWITRQCYCSKDTIATLSCRPPFITIFAQPSLCLSNQLFSLSLSLSLHSHITTPNSACYCCTEVDERQWDAMRTLILQLCLALSFPSQRSPTPRRKRRAQKDTNE